MIQSISDGAELRPASSGIPATDRNSPPSAGSYKKTAVSFTGPAVFLF